MVADGHATFTHVTAEKAELYRVIMGAFVAAKARFVVHLRPEDVTAHLGRSDPDALGAALRQLVDWGNLRADPDTARVTTVEDFNRARFLYQLTPAGEAAEQALAAYDAALGRRGELQAVALADIRTQLAALLALAGQDEPDPAKCHQLLRDLSGVFEGLADNAQAFMASLQRTVDLTEVDVPAFLAYKDRLIGYLERFIGELVVSSAEIAGLLGALDDADAGHLLELAAAREASDAAPGEDELAEAITARRLASWQQRWGGLHEWFLGTPTHPSQAAILRTRARQGITELLTLVAALNERRSGRSDRSADFRTLARWFAEADSDEDAHRLWRTAFGLAPSRHLTIDTTTLEQRAAAPVPTGTSWADAPPVVIEPRLRATGTHERRGSPARIVDRSAARAALEADLAAERAGAEEARRRLHTDGPLRLGELGTMDTGAFRAFLSLLGDALGQATEPGATVRTTTSDGSLTITLTPTRDGATAEILTADGVLRGPDHIIEIGPVVAGVPA